MRDGGGAAAPVPAHDEVQIIARMQIEREILRDVIQMRFQELERDRADREWDARWNAPVPAPARRPQYNYSSDSDDDDFNNYVRRGS